jgi:hypothetical protein
LRCCIGIFLFLLCGINSWAQKWNAFGPTTYQASQPTVSSQFSVLNSNIKYILHVTGVEGTRPRIVLNGKTIVDEDSFDHDGKPDGDKDSTKQNEKPDGDKDDGKPEIVTLDITVTLQLNNTISGQLKGAKGSSMTVSIIGTDTDPPAISVSASPAPDSFGWNNTDVTVTFTCSDKTSGIAMCPAPVTVSTEGAKQVVSGTATDKAGNAASTSVTINLDKTAPTIATSLAPPANSAGWNNSNVIVTFQCFDSGSGIANCPEPKTVNADGASQVITGTATDKAGNPATTSVTLNIDRSPPSITGHISPSPNAAGWNNTDVTVSFTCADTGSGVATCPPPVHVSSEGAGQVVNGTATDVAGNTATASVTLSIDKTPPVITASIAPQPNAVGWNNSSVTVTFQCSDSGSSIATCPGPQTVSAESANQIITGSATDIAGNTASASVTVNIEKNQPGITALSTPSANAAGWNNADVTVSFQCSASVAPIANCPQQQTVSTEGANQIVTGTVIDVAGDSAAASVTLNIDKTPPVISATISPPPDANGVNTTSVTISFTCSDSLSGVLSCPLPISVSTPGVQTISGQAVDKAGNTANAGVQVNIQNVVPLKVAVIVSPPPNAAGWNNTPVTVKFQCSGGQAPVSCPTQQTVNIDGANQVIAGTATDASGQTATARVTINLDQAPPLVAITSPVEGSISVSSQVPVNGIANDALSGISVVTCNGAPASLVGSNFNCSLLIAQVSLPISVQATDIAGNTASSTVTVSLAGPKLTITSPATLDLFSSASITVTGTVDDPNSTVTVNGVQASNSGGMFTAQGVILREGNNLIAATGVNAKGAAGTATVNVVLDTTPPTVSIDSPSDRAIVSSPQITVTGLVNDIVTGTVNAEQVSVIVNGVNASVANRSFMASGVLLVPGQNTITAVAKDRGGNISQSQITVTLRDAATQQRLLMVSGNNQTGVVRAVLPQPLTVQVVNAAGQPLPNMPVTFSLMKSDGQLAAFPRQGRQLTVQTDNNGQASVNLQLGTRVGTGNNQVSVTAPGFVGEVMFCASSTVDAASQIHDISGGSQIGVIGQPLPEAFVAGIFDASGNPVSGVPVIFKVEQGGGTLEGSTTTTKTTDADGRAAAILVLAQQEGVNNNIVSASFDGLASSPAIFTASGMTPNDPANTVVTGIVLDNANQPIPNATASIQGTNLSALTDAKGQFTIAHAPVGSLVLYIDGSTSTRPENFPFLEFPMVTVAGQDNHLGAPIYLPPLDNDNSQVVGGDEDVTLTMKGVPGVAYTVFAHSATFPDGSKVGRLTLSQVHSDKVPMIPPNGTAPRLVGTLQPARVKFNPPIRVQLPNTDGLAPGQVIEIFSFHHDLEQFVSEGTARVNEDGSVITSDPGFGLTVSGWHGGGGPPPPTTCADSCTNGCFKNASCVKGFCQGEPIKIPKVVAQADSKDPDFVKFDIDKKISTEVAFTVTAQSNCDNLEYSWDFGDQTPPDTRQNPTHQYKEAKSYVVTVTVTCKGCNQVSAFGKVRVNVVKLQIESPCTQHPELCSIDGTTPRMPTIQGIKAKVVGVEPDPTATTSFTWEAKVQVLATDCAHGTTIQAPVVTQTITGEQYVPDFATTYGATLYGGQFELTLKATIEGLDLSASTKKQPADPATNFLGNDHEHILGNDPPAAALMAAFPHNTLRAIACLESHGRQFTASGTVAGACPLWSGDGLLGVGIMQLTPYTDFGGVDVVWNWARNVTAGTGKFNSINSNPGFYGSRIVTTQTFNNIVAAMNATRVANHLPPLASVVIPPLATGNYDNNLQQLEKEVIRGYNGYAGADIFGLHLHEFRVQMDPADPTHRTFLLSIDPRTNIGTTSWEQVPAGDRPNVGDPNYVNDVMRQPPLNGGGACN